MVVILCLAVAYAGRASTLGNTGTSWSLQRSMFQPSAFPFQEGSSPDTLVRPPMANTLEASPQRLQIMHYETRAGDTISDLANRFDISENTIVWANSLAPGQTLAPGQQLIILPVSGILYTAQSGDTLDSIARRFQSDPTSIAQFNQLTGGSVATGTQLVIPGGRIEDAERPDLSSRALMRPGSDVGDASPASAPPLVAPSKVVPTTESNSSVPSISEHVPSTSRVESSKPLVPLTYYVVEGDTLSSIAERFGVSPESIAASSGLQGSVDSLSINQKLTIPPVPGVVHLVKDGDTLQALAERYSTDADKIAQANGLKDPFLLQIGQTLVIPGGKVPQATAPAPASQTKYTVAEGDSVSSIADDFGVDIQTIVDANGLAAPYILQPGQEIIIPGGHRSAAPAQPHTTYTVQQGDSLSQIADSFGISINAIINANNLSDPSSIQPGQQLTIPGASHAVVHSKPAPAPVAKAPAPSPVVVAKPATRPSTNSGWNIVSLASKYLGTPYVWGGTSPSGFDCSGFVWYVYRRAGIPIPRDLWGQLQSGSRVSRQNLQPGDIVFFANTYQRGLSHDGIYIGGGRFINAVDYGIGVAVRSLSEPYWSSRYFGATRPW